MIDTGEECDGGPDCNDDCTESLGDHLKRITVEGNYLTLANSNSESCASACDRRGRTCRGADLDGIVGYGSANQSNYHRLVQEHLGLNFRRQDGNVAHKPESLYPPQFELGQKLFWHRMLFKYVNFNGFNSDVTGNVTDARTETNASADCKAPVTTTVITPERNLCVSLRGKSQVHRR